MAFLIILSLYAIIILIYISTSLFIVYHLAKYTTRPELKIVSLAFFVIISIGLLISNMILFSYVDWTSIISNLFT